MVENIMINTEEGWDRHHKIMVILAHPDDPEFFCGATINRWAKSGHEIHYLLLTLGDKGGDKTVSPEELIKTRQKEQKAAAEILGVKNIRFLNHEDGYLIADLNLRKEIVREIRKTAPDIVVGCDPTNYFTRPGAVNHPDHRAAGQAVVDAVFPAVGNYHYFPDLLAEGLEPVQVKELWLSIPAAPNFVLDVTPNWEFKMKALYEHRSQIGNREQFDARMQTRRTADSTPENPRFEEKFNRIVFA